MKKALITAVLFLSDVSGIVLSYLTAYTIRKFLVAHALSFLPPTLAFDLFIERYYLLLFWVLVLAYEGLYTRRYPFWTEMHRLWRAGLVATMLITAVMFVAGESFYFSRLVVLLALPVSFILMPLFRAITRRLLAAIGLWHKHACLVAKPERVESIKAAVESDRALGYKVVKIMNRWEPEAGFNGAKVLIVQMELLNGKGAGQLVEQAESQGIREVLMAPDLKGLRLSNVTLENLESTVFIKHEEGLLTPGKMRLKTGVDFFISLILLGLSLPLYPIIALFIKLDSPGPVIFKHQRVGKDGKLFTCYKFRTMFKDADKRLKEHLASDPKAKIEWEQYSKLLKDPRITRVGKFLRKTSLDELPQFFNVLKGDMSLVGPRPYMEYEIAKMQDMVHTIIKVKPGITGLWQVSGRNDIDFRNRLVLDEYYVRNWSLWLDFIILLKTFKAVVSAKGAY